MRGIFSMDPGGHTGLAWGVFDPTASVEDALKNGIQKGSHTTEGSEYGQIKEIANLWMDFYRRCVFEGQMDPDDVEFVAEDFVLRPGRHAGGKDGISPVRILWGVEGYRLGRADEFKGRRASKVHNPPIILQQPNQASTFATNPRLKTWGVWVRGREHERSAWRHIALRLANLNRIV